MASSFGALTRAAAAVATSVVLVALAAGPAAASRVDMTFDDGEERGTTMGVGQAFLVFVVLPLAVAAIVWLLVKAPGWTRSGRANETDAWTGEPLSVTSSDRPGLVSSGQAPADPDADQSFVPDSDDKNVPGAGGTSARW
jgi:uncharacterized membrane protein YdfJ with MMPL/SSD domain